MPTVYSSLPALPGKTCLPFMTSLSESRVTAPVHAPPTNPFTPPCMHPGRGESYSQELRSFGVSESDHERPRPQSRPSSRTRPRSRKESLAAVHELWHDISSRPMAVQTPERHPSNEQLNSPREPQVSVEPIRESILCTSIKTNALA